MCLLCFAAVGIQLWFGVELSTTLLVLILEFVKMRIFKISSDLHDLNDYRCCGG